MRRANLLLAASLCLVVVALVAGIHSHRTELGENFWHNSQGYHDLDQSVQDYVGAQFKNDVESNVASIIHQWHQAGGTTLEDHGNFDDDGETNADSDNAFADDSSDSDSNNDNDNGNGDGNNNNDQGDQEDEWRSYSTVHHHDRNIQGDAKSALHKEVQEAIRSAMKGGGGGGNDDDENHFGNEPSRWLRKSSDSYEDKARKLRERTRTLRHELEKDKWVAKKWNAGYDHDKVLQHNIRYLEHHNRIKKIRHESRMRIPKFHLAKKQAAARKREKSVPLIRHIKSENHDSDVDKIFDEPDPDAVSKPQSKAVSSERAKLDSEISKQTGWLKDADKNLKGHVENVKGELNDLRGEVKNLADQMASQKNAGDRENILRSVDHNLREIAEGVVHMRAAERARQLSREEFESAAKTAKAGLQAAKKSVEGVLHRGLHH